MKKVRQAKEGVSEALGCAVLAFAGLIALGLFLTVGLEWRIVILALLLLAAPSLPESLATEHLGVKAAYAQNSDGPEEDTSGEGTSGEDPEGEDAPDGAPTP